MSESREMTLRQKFNSTVRLQYQETHTPQCRKCMRFHPWGNSIMQIHHILPLVDGGDNEEGNLITLCVDCHKEWHEHQEGKADFQTWLQAVPGWAYSAIGVLRNQDQRKLSFADIESRWWCAREYRMLKEPYKTDEYQQYTKEHCANWVDW